MVRGQMERILATLTQLLHKDDHSFDPEELILLVDTFENAISDAGIDRESPTALAAARQIIEIAKQGERDPDRLRDEAIKVFQLAGQERPGHLERRWSGAGYSAALEGVNTQSNEQAD